MNSIIKSSRFLDISFAFRPIFLYPRQIYRRSRRSERRRAREKRMRVRVHRVATAAYRVLLSRASERCIGDTASIDIDVVDPVTANARVSERASERAADEYRAGTHTRTRAPHTYTHSHAQARGHMDIEARARARAGSALTLVTRRSRERLPAADAFTLVFAQSLRPCEVCLRLGRPFSRARVSADVFFFFSFFPGVPSGRRSEFRRE